MKKRMAMLLVIVFMLSICGAFAFAEDEGRSRNTENTTSEQASGKWTKADIMQMSNYMNGGIFCQTGKWQIRQTSANNGSLESRNTMSGESAVISRGVPCFINADGLWVTYLAVNNNRSSTQIKRISVTGGSEQTLIEQKDLPVSGSIRYMQVYDGYLYFAVNNENVHPITGQFLRADMDGQNITTILEKAVYYPYIIDDKVYFQDDGDRGRMHVCNLDGSDDHVFIDDVTYEFIFDGTGFYYDSYDGEAEFDDRGFVTNESELNRVLKYYTPGEGIKVMENVHPHTFTFDGETILYVNALDADRLYSYDLKTGSIDPLYFNDHLIYVNYIDESRVIAQDCNDRMIVENIIMANTDGTGIRVES